MCFPIGCVPLPPLIELRTSMILKKYVAIDIGSNAIRLLISTYMHESKLAKRPKVKKTSLIRIPIRLGEDVFAKQKISPEKHRKLVNTLVAFSHIIDAYEINRVMACATSAMRDAENGAQIVKEIKKKSGIHIDIINGEKEADYIATTDLKDYIAPDKNYLYVDVGGGSTEFTLYAKGKVVATKSFQIGTVRLMLDQVSEDMWADAEAWIRKSTKPYKDISLIGSGGNINCIFKRSGQKVGKPLSTEYIKRTYAELRAHTYKERVVLLGMKVDRADVIVPALEIYTKALKWGKSRRIYVPKIGLADGMVNYMIKEDFGRTP